MYLFGEFVKLEIEMFSSILAANDMNLVFQSDVSQY